MLSLHNSIGVAEHEYNTISTEEHLVNESVLVDSTACFTRLALGLIVKGRRRRKGKR